MHRGPLRHHFALFNKQFYVRTRLVETRYKINVKIVKIVSLVKIVYLPKFQSVKIVVEEMKTNLGS
jgi:hypothetical protein